MSTVRDPIDPTIDRDKLIQVTDLVGIKQTGYYQGRPYYGSVFYQDGVKYAGWYKTAGELVQIYDTLQESIDAEVTTPASAILDRVVTLLAMTNDLIFQVLLRILLKGN